MKVFTKFDPRQRYNNVQIKKEDKWKMAFITPKESFKLTIMFFRLTNFPAIFQTIMNKILWNLINTGEVVSFIDDIIVRTEKEEEYDEAVKEIVKRLAENDLYVKSEEYKQKIKKVGFLKVVTGLEGLRQKKRK